ncbi:type V toxin-antitoxin system endoribonuclease antitoxin GhoS [Amantichitinum ursilacus]|uniref:DUF2622 domain-containing protein n=1 Tax=Amantichitinum ursilacus TaxID=857265 RepID=A0A0N0GLZ8_9NEIS|nr:type V toxin-antitoxin system endoribonuclease antitoxin GhoS [Amantichitinum ursilacus]KPC50634.1 hypothetical protein WG78_16310 [Amantichitinum ursilacus]
MQYYFVRVELHESHSARFADLHQKMEAVGFMGGIAGNDGNFYRLPSGMYCTRSDLSVNDVKEVARHVASEFGPNWVFVMQAGDWSGYLDQIIPKPNA